MQKGFQKNKFKGENYKIGVIKARFNEIITGGLLKGCLQGLQECAVKKEHIKILEVPGSFELAIGAQKLAQSKKYDALICLGAIIKGETRHDEYIAHACGQGLTNVSLKYNLPVLFGVVTALNLKQARERSSTNGSGDNRGYEAALSAIEMLENLQGAK